MNTSSATRTGVLAATGNKDEAEEDSVSLGFYLSLQFQPRPYSGIPLGMMVRNDSIGRQIGEVCHLSCNKFDVDPRFRRDSPICLKDSLRKFGLFVEQQRCRYRSGNRSLQTSIRPSSDFSSAL